VVFGGQTVPLPDILLLDPANAQSYVQVGGTVDNAAVGSATPALGDFTTLQVSGAVSGAGFVALHAAPGPIGSTTPSSGAFTTISASGAITPSQTAGIVGTTAANNANAGSIGELITATASGVALTTGTTANVCSISLTAGDWEVSGAISLGNAGNNMTFITAGSSTTSAGNGAFGDYL
jgi:hypothetical protein